MFSGPDLGRLRFRLGFELVVDQKMQKIPRQKNLSIANVDFEDAAEIARFREERDSLYAKRKGAIIADFKRNGDLDEQGQWVFKKPLPGAFSNP